jgi:hypothetical protein
MPYFPAYCPDFDPTNKDLFGLFYDFRHDEEVSTRQWVYTVTNSTAPTVVDAGAKGGTATFTNTGADNDRIEAQGVSEIFKLDGLGQQTLFLCRQKPSTITLVDLNFGIGITDTDSLGDTAFISDGLLWQLDSGATSWAGIAAFNAAELADYSRQNGMKAAVADAQHRFAILVETDPTTLGKGKVRWYYDGSQVAIYQTESGICHDEELALLFGIQNGEASAKSMVLDCIGCFQTRS